MGASQGALKAGVAGLLSVLEQGVYKLQGADQARANSKWLWGNFAPIEGDLYAADLPVEGTLPPEVAGLFARNGPNPLFIAGDVHWFDGDGYVHSVLLDPETQTAAYSGHQVQTSKLKQEIAAGRGLFQKFGDLNNGPLGLAHVAIETVRKKLGLITAENGIGTANTALLWHGGMLHALHEGDQPYVLRVTEEGRIETVKRIHKGGPDPVTSWFTAHPKVDPETNKLYAFGYSLQKPPYLTFYQLDADGKEIRHIPLNFSKPVMTHDFAITNKHAIWFESSLYISPADLVNPRKGQAFRFDVDKPTRILVVPLDATSPEQAVWMKDELPASFLFHFANAWEEEDGNVIRLVVERYKEFHLSFEGTIDKDGPPKYMTKQQLDDRATHLYEYKLDMQTGGVTYRRLIRAEDDPRMHEFPQVDPRLVGRKSRFVYNSVYTPKGESESFVKVDLLPTFSGDAPAVSEVYYGNGTYGGEVLFVPREGGESEDDGYALTFTHSYPEDTSEFRVYDVKSMSSTPVARVKLPRRVPYGFHACFVPNSELARQSCPGE